MSCSLWINAVGAFKVSFRKCSRSFSEAESTKQIARYHVEHVIGFGWNKVAALSVDVNAFESTGKPIYPLNRNGVPEYFFSMCDTSEAVSFMQIALPDMAPICAPST
jgi:hypothetical protein